MKIIVADDSATARMFIRQCLEICGQQDAEFREAGNGREALDLLNEEPADLLVTDLNMPIVDGRELIRRISASPRWHGMPIMVVTSSGNEARRRELVALGATVVLNKPVNPTTVSEGMDRILQNQEG